MSSVPEPTAPDTLREVIRIDDGQDEVRYLSHILRGPPLR
jgi:hypothetical protein